RKARVVLCDTDGVRAPVVATWLKQLGWDVSLLEQPHLLDDLPAPVAPLPALAHTRDLDPGQLAEFLAQHPQADMLDARPSVRFRRGSPSGARWVIRPQLDGYLAQGLREPLVLLGESRARLTLLAADLERAGHRDIRLCVGDETALRTCGLPMVSHDDMPDAAC